MNNKKLRIFFNSNAMYSISGYGQQMAELLPRIEKEGYPLAICNFFGSQGGKFVLNNIIQYPVQNHVYGSDALIHHANDFKADVSFSLQDTWVLNPEDLVKVNRWIPITPIDSNPVQKSILNNLRYAYKIITYSKFGQKQLQENGLFSTYIPHTVDTNIFKPMDKKLRKKESNLPEDCFLVGMVAANKDFESRKSFQKVLDAFKLFLDKEPKALLYIHTDPHFPNGFPIDGYAEFIGIRNRVLFPDAYQMNFNTKKDNMNLIYNTFDVLLNPSKHEGFGVAIIEAQAAGIPVIANRWTSMPELIIEGDTGFLTDTAELEFSRIGSYMAPPTILSIYDCLMKVHTANTLEMGKKARKFMVENYDSDTVYKDKWSPFLQSLEEEVYPLASNEKKV